MRWILAFALSVAALAQEPLRVTTRLVEVVAIARDKHGAVADLTKSDFELTDKGKRRPIATFHVAKSTDRSPRAALPPNVFSNRLDRQSEPPVSATVILFDQLNTAFTDQASARRQIAGLLESLDPDAPVAIYALGQNLRVVHDFTDSPSRLADALRRGKNSSSNLLERSQPDPNLPAAPDPALGTSTNPSPDSAALNTATISPPTSDLTARILEPLQSYALDRRVALTFSAMQLIANRMSGVPGRKNLIWLSGAFPLSMGIERSTFTGGTVRSNTYTAQMREAASAFDRANIAIYPVDVRGLQVSGSIQAATPLPRNQATQGTYSINGVDPSAQTREVETMNLLANWTGGRAYYNTNNIRQAVKQAMDDAEVSYTLGFYVEEKELDGSYHELRLKVARKDTDVRYRKGYFATAVPRSQSDSAIELLHAAIRAPADATGIGLVASLTPAPEKPGSYMLALGINLQNLRLEEKDSHWIGGVNFSFTQESAEGLVLDAMDNKIDIDTTDANRKKLLVDGVTLRLLMTPAPGLSQIRIAVMDQLNANVGSLRIVPPKLP